MYLEDLYVQPAHRGSGIGKALLAHLGALAVATRLRALRVERARLEPRTPSRFYERMGATVMPDWRICRVSGEALARFAKAGQR